MSGLSFVNFEINVTVAEKFEMSGIDELQIPKKDPSHGVSLTVSCITVRQEPITWVSTSWNHVINMAPL
jgi:hypothetical protein